MSVVSIIGLIIPVFFVDKLNTPYYITPITFFSSLLILYNFPWLARFLHEKQYCYDDLELSNLNVRPDVKVKFQRVFNIVMEILLSGVMAALINYGLYQIHDGTLTITQQLGIIGGIKELFLTAQDYIGRGLLYVLSKQKLSFERRLSESELKNMLPIPQSSPPLLSAEPPRLSISPITLETRRDVIGE